MSVLLDGQAIPAQQTQATAPLGWYRRRDLYRPMSRFQMP